MRRWLRARVVAGVAAGLLMMESPARVAAQTDAGQAGQTSAATAESIESAKAYFDRARKLGFAAAGQKAPYVLRASFTTREVEGEVATGSYTDTWVSDKKWRREAVLGKSRFARSRNGRKLYRLAEGPDAALLQYVLTAMEPIPATDAGFIEADWRVTRDTVDGAPAVRVARGKENAGGAPDAETFRAYWFDASGQLVKSYGNNLETRRTDFRDFNGVKVAREVDVLVGGKVGMRINVTDLEPAGKLDGHMFTIKKHGWVRQFTDEAR